MNMDKPTKKEMQAQYKEREIVGGVYAVKNTAKNKLLIDAATDLSGAKNRFDFSMNTGSCVHPKLQNDWKEQNGKQFVFEVLEELKKGDTQSPAAFKADMEVLKQMWLEKSSGEELY